MRGGQAGEPGQAGQGEGEGDGTHHGGKSGGHACGSLVSLAGRLRASRYMRSSCLRSALSVCVSGKPWQASRSEDRKSTRLNSSHLVISYAGFCLKKKKTHTP